MAYTTNQAIETLNGYLGINNGEKEIIENTKNRGFVFSLPNGEKAVIFVYPLVHKQDNTKNYFDTRDSGAYERGVTWNYAIDNNLKYFCIGVNDTVDKYDGYAFSLECNESDIEKISGTINGSRNGPGNQIIIPNDYAPSKQVERIVNKLGIYITAVHKDNLIDYLTFYDNRPYMENAVLANLDELVDDTYVEREDPFKTGYESSFSRNRILFGAPGTGKSFSINRDRIELLGEGNEDDYERVTFHPDYSYANFVGTYKPVMVDDSAETISLATEKEVLAVLTDESKSAQEKYDLLYDRFKGDGLTRLPLLLGLYTDESFKTRKADGSDAAGDNSVERNHGKAIRSYVNLSKPSKGKKDISYEYVLGPFMRMYIKALKNSRTDNVKPFLLIIEEINRANVAAVFGDIFQLLDRGDDFVSEYPIQATEDVKKYLARELGGDPSDYNKIKIPDNMFIWATMNSADQGVFPMDTAFKRRWDFTYLGIDDNDQDLQGKYVYLADDKSQKVEWNKLRKAINNFLAKEKINEDKQLGPYFISRSIVVPKTGAEIDRDRFISTFKNKVIMYLFEDAAKQKRARLFEGCFQNNSRYSEICREFEAKGVGIFNHDIQLDCEVEDVKSNDESQE
ncbi:hypothetical protein C805_00341 [Eubacterium sp. 14-2]|uniref:hypothetical protein n=1 Tax=Eubacterium sp. 14-2 TaxID=1235790 RepID=UPI0003351467|nr:hypothetical protein [Eubacterium sp. 14-2]EOT28820.1 hypothetical protein C805_00341 [Eubacterium sp. 14-2]